MTKKQIPLYFLKLGASGFGGPLALIAHMQKDLVGRHKLIDETEFRNSLGFIKSLPGPVALQMVAYHSYQIGGFLTAVFSSFLFVLPASLMMTAIAIFYNDLYSFSAVNTWLEGIQGAVFLIIALALLPLSKGYRQSFIFWLLLFFSFLLVWKMGVSEPIVILLAGTMSLASRYLIRHQLRSFILLDIFWVCLKAGGLAFGTGLAIIPLLQRDFVDLHQWVTQKQFLDAIAFGQMTPGPVSVTVTFVGYKVAGLSGALIATLGIFLPGFINMTTWFPRLYHSLRSQKWVGDFVMGATAAICAGILFVLQTLFSSVQVGSMIVPGILFAVSFRRHVPTWLLILMSGLTWWGRSLISSY
jgi:chromate transporter